MTDEPDALTKYHEMSIKLARAAMAEEIADAIEAESLRIRREDFRSGKVGIEYINGFEDAARIAWEQARQERS